PYHCIDLLYWLWPTFNSYINRPVSGELSLDKAGTDLKHSPLKVGILWLKEIKTIPPNSWSIKLKQPVWFPAQSLQNKNDHTSK
ncbi:hypothetical protein FE66_15220, partial [Staphylococcus aureus]